ncbi:MAG: di-heme oxidoredictase family protein [Gemmatimonadaceae bacterium]
MARLARCYCARRSFASCLTPLLVAVACADSTAIDRTPAVPETELSAGSATVFDVTGRAFEQPVPALTGQRLAQHELGDSLFALGFLDAATSPAGAPNVGLGPLFNNTSCFACHEQNGRGQPPLVPRAFRGMLFRLSVPGFVADAPPRPVPGYGGQLQNRAIVGTPPEGTVDISYERIDGQFADGTRYELQRPTYRLASLYIPPPPNVMVSPRVAPQIVGLGLLEAVPDALILVRSDENDRDGDGISGKANVISGGITTGRQLGRFGHKANTASLLIQAATAYNEDVGITSPLLPTEHCALQLPICSQHTPDVTSAHLDAVVFYTRTLAVPARRNVHDAEVRRGATLFAQVRCTACHTPTLRTAATGVEPELANLTIQPYTDLLLHDMGPELADGRPDFRASGSEWRTPPLWGIGLSAFVTGHTRFLHDGRARSLEEAVLWHGGEALAARELYRGLTKSERDALLRFLGSL